MLTEMVLMEKIKYKIWYLSHIEALSGYLYRHGQRPESLIMLNSAEHEIYPALKCLNVNICWHFNIY